MKTLYRINSQNTIHSMTIMKKLAFLILRRKLLMIKKLNAHTIHSMKTMMMTMSRRLKRLKKIIWVRKRKERGKFPTLIVLILSKTTMISNQVKLIKVWKVMNQKTLEAIKAPPPRVRIPLMTIMMNVQVMM